MELTQIGLWRKARPIDRQKVISAPDKREIHLWEVGGEVGVIEKEAGKRFISFQVVTDKRIDQVAGAIRRQIKRNTKEVQQ